MGGSGVRYVEISIDDDVLDETAQEDLELMTVLQSVLEEVDAAYSKERLAAIVAESLGKGVPAKPAFSVGTTNAELHLESVDRYCNLAELDSEEDLGHVCGFSWGFNGSTAQCSCLLGRHC
jgi:hypothetical protein